MKKIFVQLLNQISKLNNPFQLAGFMISSIFILIIFSIAQEVLIKILSFIALFTILLFFLPFFNKYIEYLKHRDWNKKTNEYLKAQDPMKSPAYVATVGLERTKGKESAYNHVIEEIKNLETSSIPNDQKIQKLKERIISTLNSLNN